MSKKKRENESDYFSREKKLKRTHEGVPLDIPDSLRRDEESPDGPDGSDDQPQGRRRASTAAAPDQDRRRRCRHRSRDSQRQGRPAPCALPQQGALVQIFSEDRDGVGYRLLGDGKGGALGDVCLRFERGRGGEEEEGEGWEEKRRGEEDREEGKSVRKRGSREKGRVSKRKSDRKECVCARFR